MKKLNYKSLFFKARFVKKLFGTVTLCTATVMAAGFYGNQSDIHWKTAGSPHFQFHYPAEYTDHAAKASAYAEAVYDSVVGRYHDLPGRVNVTLNNALYSNGSAIPSENALNLWLTNWDFKVRSSHGWLTDVVTHEFSHLVSIESGSKVNPHVYGFQFSYTDFYNERTTSDFATLLPFTLQPLWLAEGTAQYESSRMGFDAWDSHRDMLLRVAALNDSLLSLEYMHDFSDNSLFAELGPYTQGFALVRYIASHYGDDAVPKIWMNLSKYNRMTLDGAIREVLGISEEQLYEDWKKEITESYQALKDSLGELVEGTKLTKETFWNDFPIIAGKHLYGVSNFGGPWFDGGLFKMPLEDEKDSSATDSLAQDSTSKGNVEIGEVDIEGADSTINISDFAKTGFKLKKAWLDKGIDVYEDSIRGPMLAYVTFQNRDKDGHAHFDIAIADTNKNEISISYLADAVYPAFDPQGSSIVFVRREPYSTRFVLSKVPFSADLDNFEQTDPIDIFVPDSSFKYYNIYSPKFSPDGKKIAFGYFDNEIRGIAILDADGKNFKIISNSQFDERDVNWLDNEKIIFSSNRNGIFNLIEKNINTGVEHPLTNVIGGAFTPVLAGDTLYYTNYDKDGFSLYKLAYSLFVPAASDTTLNITERDSVIQISDTTWSRCPADSATVQADSAIAQNASTLTDSSVIDSVAPCVPEPTIVLRDSTIKIADTTRTIVTREGSKEIVLKGSPLPRITKNLEFQDTEFAGIEEDYKPIPTVPMFIPMLALTESAPDLTVFGDGQVRVMAGLAFLLSDPLKKNTVQLGLLWQLDEGFSLDKSDREFFASWENRSTPIDLSLSYSYSYNTSKDTVRYEEVALHNGDSLGISNYGVSAQAISAGAGYSPFKSIDTLQIAVAYDWADFDLFEDQFRWTYQKRISAMTALGLYGDIDEGTGISGQGNGLLLYYQYSNSDLFRPGSFAESFTVNANGTISPHYRNFNIHEMGLNLYGSIQSPWTGARLAAGGKISGIVHWNTNGKAKEDSLDAYYFTPVFLEGYPYLRSSEDFTLAGTRTAVAEVHYLFPIYDDWRKRLWIFNTHSFYFDLFAQIGAAWNGRFFDPHKFKNNRFWDRDVGLSFRWSNKLFHSIPLDVNLTFARALSRIGEDENLQGGRKLTPVDLPIIPESIAPTRIKFSIGMGFSNSWQ